MKRGGMQRAVAALVALASGSTLAGAAWNTCNGVPVRPFFQKVTWRANGCSFKDFESAHGRAVVRSVTELGAFWTWGVVAPLPNPADPCHITHGDGSWDIALVDPGVIDGAAGLSQPDTDGCTFSWEEKHILSDDVMIAVDFDFSDPDGVSFFKPDSVSPGEGRIAMLHEFGHAFGLEHSTSFAVMRPDLQELPLGGATPSGAHAYFMGDDAAGMQNLIGIPGGVPNAYVSAQMLRNGTMANVSVDPATGKEHGVPTFVNVGETVSFFFSVGTTLWDSRLPFTVRIYADEPGTCTSLDGVGTELMRLNGSVGKFGTVTQQVNVVIPSAIPRNKKLQVFVGIDPENVLLNPANPMWKEARGWDNCAATKMFLNVRP